MVLAAGIVGALPAASAAPAPVYNALYSFQSSGEASDGAVPEARPTPGAANVFYGTTADGGTGACTDINGVTGCGTVFELKNTNGVWTETVLYSFQGGSDGAAPLAHLLYSHGVLYGTTAAGGIDAATCAQSNSAGARNGCGTVFELSSRRGVWSETVLYRFGGGADGANPYAGVVADAHGVLYGTTLFGGKVPSHCNLGAFGSGCGTAYSLTPPTSPGGEWTEHVLHAFAGGADGANPASELVLDSAGTLYATTLYGGNTLCFGDVGCGIVFALTPPSLAGQRWSESILHRFVGGQDGESPETGPLALTADGTLYGTTEEGGSSGCAFDGEPLGCGTVFAVAPPTASQPHWTERVLYRFQAGADGWYPIGGVVASAAGTLYGTTLNYYDVSTPDPDGTVFELKPPAAPTGVWKKTLLHYFAGAPDGLYPQAGLVLNKGLLYGATLYGGVANAGMLYSIKP